MEEVMSVEDVDDSNDKRLVVWRPLNLRRKPVYSMAAVMGGYMGLCSIVYRHLRVGPRDLPLDHVVKGNRFIGTAYDWTDPFAFSGLESGFLLEGNASTAGEGRAPAPASATPFGAEKQRLVKRVPSPSSSSTSSPCSSSSSSSSPTASKLDFFSFGQALAQASAAAAAAAPAPTGNPFGDAEDDALFTVQLPSRCGEFYFGSSSAKSGQASPPSPSADTPAPASGGSAGEAAGCPPAGGGGSRGGPTPALAAPPPNRRRSQFLHSRGVGRVSTRGGRGGTLAAPLRLSPSGAAAAQAAGAEEVPLHLSLSGTAGAAEAAGAAQGMAFAPAGPDRWQCREVLRRVLDFMRCREAGAEAAGGAPAPGVGRSIFSEAEGEKDDPLAALWVAVRAAIEGSDWQVLEFVYAEGFEKTGGVSRIRKRIRQERLKAKKKKEKESEEEVQGTA